ncbi:sensor histidine kinase [Sporosarcina gallistercoris]|uniref:Histidine kinase n=1 Tax=Sporosarcina gallistercoris TaxID=2762245 RepID=A0ABR8PJQ4_9BACL|nr:cache domain-containing protein [Sporosarcina gallistercoris]MBD7908420.1 histidine kinase [Sporosarcina gallistercoris]
MKRIRPNTYRKLRVQIALHYILASGLTLLLMAGILYASISSILLSEAAKSTKSSVNQSGMYLDLYIDRLNAVSSLLAENPQLVSYLSDPTRSPAVKNDLLKTIDTTLASDEFMKSIIIVTKDGQILSNESGLTMSKSTNMMQETWYRSAIKNGGQAFLTSARMQDFTMDKDTWVISISREITDAAGENRGVLLIDLDYEVIEDYLADLDLGKEGFSFILNENQEVVYHADPAYFQNDRKKRELKAIVDDQAEYDSKENTLTYTHSLKNADWLLVSVSSQDSLLAMKKQLIEIFFWVGISLLLVAATSVYLFAGRITAPFQKLEQAMQNIEMGLKEIPVDEKGCYEAQSLTRHFNTMTHKIEKLMLEITEKEKHLRTSEISALHSQINPHFLYNTLDTIVWMAEFGDHEKVIDLTKALASFFRLSLSGGSELTTVENELEHVERYLFIQKERYGDKLKYEIHCDEAVKDIEMPKLIVQPIAENALYHGIRGLSDGGVISISAVSEGDDLVLIVHDTGDGYDVEAVNDAGANVTTKLGGVGIRNVDERIRLYYGEEYGVRVHSSKTEGTTVRIHLASSVRS